MRVVLDTNVLISAFANPAGTPGRIFNAWTREEFVLVISTYILDEFKQIAVKKLRFRHTVVTEALNLFYRLAVVVEPVDIDLPNVDENDLPIFGTAISGGSNFIVTGDKKLLRVEKFKEIKIINPASFLKELE